MSTELPVLAVEATKHFSWGWAVITVVLLGLVALFIWIAYEETQDKSYTTWTKTWGAIGGGLAAAAFLGLAACAGKEIYSKDN